jgi:TonB family protein
MLIALGVLLLALIAVIIKDRQYWFPPSPGAESEAPEQVASSNPAPAAAPKTATQIPPSKIRAGHDARSKSKPQSKTAHATAPQSDAPFIVATNRAVLPPLEVEVVAGNQHQAVKPGDSSVKLEMQPSAPDADAQTSAPAERQNNNDPAENHAAAQVQMSPGSAQVVSRVNPTYPLLAKQMKVQGAVVLEALIGRKGNIQGIQVLSGPAILSEAAREAVRQWHFKPYYQRGQPVETQARITVNFTISTY